VRQKNTPHKREQTTKQAIRGGKNAMTNTTTRTEEIKTFKAMYSKAKQETSLLFNGVRADKELCIDTAYSIVNDLMKHTRSFREMHTFIRCQRDADDHVCAHAVNVGVLCNICARWLNYCEEERMVLTVAGLMHDIGKTETPPELINKPGKLTVQEFDVVKLHVLQGYNMLKKLDIPNEIKMAALMHHEKQDGSGYMYGLEEEAIHKHAKIVAICDIYDAMVSVRAYKNNVCPLDSLKTMENSMRDKLSWGYMYIFKNKLIETYIGKQPAYSA
jgi:putative nucleotidyltransferase with HDIG domain